MINLLDVDAGLDVDNVLTVPVALPPSESPESVSAFFRELLEGLRNRPGVIHVGFTSHLPMGFDDSRSGLAVEGRPRDPKEQVRAHWRVITSGYFAAIGIRLVNGRTPTDAETEARASVAVINSTAAERYWPGLNPVGRRLRILTPEWRAIIGVAEDVPPLGAGCTREPGGVSAGLQSDEPGGPRQPASNRADAESYEASFDGCRRHCRCPASARWPMCVPDGLLHRGSI